MASTALAAALAPPQHPLRLGRRCRDLPHAAGHRRRDGHARRADRAARARIRLGQCADLLGAGAAHPAVRIVRAVCRRLHESLRCPPRHRLRAGADRDRTVGLAGDDAGVAARPAVGRRRRHRHRSHRHGAGGDGRDTLVQSSPRPGHGHAGGEFGDRPAHLSAADRRTHHALRLAHGAGFRVRRAGAHRDRRVRSSCATGRAISICRSTAKPR